MSVIAENRRVNHIQRQIISTEIEEEVRRNKSNPNGQQQSGRISHREFIKIKIWFSDR